MAKMWLGIYIVSHANGSKLLKGKKKSEINKQYIMTCTSSINKVNLLKWKPKSQ